MKTSQYLLLFLGIAGLFGCQSTNPPAGEDRFAQADTNHDGRLSPDEASDYFVRQIFASRDLNHDGQLTWEEWHVPGAEQSKANFTKADTNHDGQLSAEEAQAWGRSHHLFAKEFREADMNHDGYVTREEAQSYYASKEGSPR